MSSSSIQRGMLGRLWCVGLSAIVLAPSFQCTPAPADGARPDAAPSDAAAASTGGAVARGSGGIMGAGGTGGGASTITGGSTGIGTGGIVTVGSGGAGGTGGGASTGGAAGGNTNPGTGGGALGGGSGTGGVAGAGVGSSGGAGGTSSGAASRAFYPQDITFTSTTNKANPYMDVTDFKVTFTGPQGEKLVLPGFYTGNQVWKVRFAPTSPATYTYVTSSLQDTSLNGLAGTTMPPALNVNSHGALKVDPTRPHHFLHEDGTRPYLMGYEVDWLGLMDFGDANVPKAKAIVDMFVANGFNAVIMNAVAYDTSWNTGRTSAFDFGPPALHAWGGTNAAPDHTKMNEAYWQSYDRVVAYLFEKGVTAHLFFRVYNKMVRWPLNGSAADNMYFKFLTARYQAYSNMVWDFSKESFYEKDHAYIAGRLNLIKSNDAYQRLRTLHDSDGGQSQFSPNYYDGTAATGTVNFYTDQSDNHYSTAKAALAKRAMPYYNSETTLYQIGNDGTYTYSRRQPKEEVFAASMEVAMAGGYFAYYYTLHAWDVVKYNEVPDGIGMYKTLSTVLKSTAWFDMVASDALVGGGAIGTHCLAAPGKEYLVYKAGSGNVTLNVAGAAGPFTAKWVNLVTGAQTALPDQTNGSRAFTNPWPGPALLHLVVR